MKSPCKECVFAQYEDKTQTGCELGLIEKYQSKGLVEECYDEEKEFFVVGQLCMYSRGPDWKPQNRIETVREEVKFKADLIILFSGSLENLKVTLANATQFSSVIVVNQGNNTPANEIVALLKGKIDKWFVESTFVEHEGREIDIAAKRTKSSYYVVVKSGTEIPSDYCERANKVIEDGLLAFIALKTHWNNGVADIYNKPIHKLLGGHEEGSIEAKVEEICKVSEQPREKYLLEVQV